MGSAFQQLLWYLIAGTRGGANRVRILEALREQPRNAHQLSEALALDYRTIRHHLDLLRKNGIVTQPVGNAYASPYFLSVAFEAHRAAYEEIRDKVQPREDEERIGEARRGNPDRRGRT